MTTEAPTHLEIDRAQVGTLDLGSCVVPHVFLPDAPFLHTHLRVDDVEYAYERSYLIRGSSAVMPEVVSGLLKQGRLALVVERSDRYYVYAA